MDNRITFDKTPSSLSPEVLNSQGRVFVIPGRNSFQWRRIESDSPQNELPLQEALFLGLFAPKDSQYSDKGNRTDGIEQALELAMQDRFLVLKDWQLEQAGINPARLRTTFSKQHGLTFHSFLRQNRLNLAFERLRKQVKGKHIGFGYLRKKTRQSEMAELLVNKIKSPLGPMFVVASDKGISLLEFTDRRMLETSLGLLQDRRKVRLRYGTNSHIQGCQKELDGYFDGSRTTFCIPLDPEGTAFQKKAWSGLQDIPYGMTQSYANQAMSLGIASGTRAVAAANGKNILSIIIPCHRLIGSDGKLTGYGGGLHRKQWLLEHESRIGTDLA